MHLFKSALFCVAIVALVGCNQEQTIPVTGNGGSSTAFAGFDDVKQAAAAGDADAQLTLARLYAEGDVVREDAAAAAKWYLLAAEQGQSDAQVWLGMAYETGQGVPMDRVEAYAWFDIASASIKNAELRRDGVKALLSSSQLTLAERRATELVEKYGNEK